MTIEPCKLIEPPPSTFWLTAKATLASPLTPQQASERLQNALPRMVVPPGAGTLLPIKRVYGGRVQEGSFSLHGPWARYAGAKLSVRGTISSHTRGSLIHLTVYPLSALVPPLFCGSVCLFLVVAFVIAAFNGPFNFLSVLVPMILILPPATLGIGLYVFNLTRSRTQLAYLLNYLQSLFNGTPGTSIPPRQQEPPRVAPPRVTPSHMTPPVDHTWASRATFMMIGAFALGGIGLLVSCLGIPLIFLPPAWHEHQTVQRMVETRCSVLDNRIVEKRDAVMKQKRQGGRIVQVPTGEVRMTYKPEFLVRCEVAGQTYETWIYRLPSVGGFQSRGDAEQTLEQFAIGQEHPGWYDPLEPETVVLDRRTNEWVIVPFTFFFVAVFFAPSAAAIVVGVILLRKLRRGARGRS